MLRAWTGPCAAKEVATVLAYECELPGVVEGTEHVLVPVEAASFDEAVRELSSVVAKYAPAFRWLQFRAAC
jgi:hypothetical protein